MDQDVMTERAKNWFSKRRITAEQFAAAVARKEDDSDEFKSQISYSGNASGNDVVESIEGPPPQVDGDNEGSMFQSADKGKTPLRDAESPSSLVREDTPQRSADEERRLAYERRKAAWLAGDDLRQQREAFPSSETL